ncbi:Actin-related protein 2/3 complex subunit 3 [Rhizoctonia solani]|uniref:Actin-related protein 2/3 complex subunit 3 n=1 Tax=Rhizoctonia solani TaxID=456999 RepID=A0A8H7IJP7_9AGAM|nr:Actin-related protein 2/3 complex subunit 3 [Rhizoctonia solani]
MPAYHSAYNEEPDVRLVGNMSILPINSRIRGPAPLQADPSQPDIIDETLDLFRANSLFRNFEIKGPADRLLIVLILFISDCLAKISAARTPPTQIECTKLLNTLAVESFAIPGDAGFPLTHTTNHQRAGLTVIISALISPKSVKSLPRVLWTDSMQMVPENRANGGSASPRGDS